MPVIIYRTGHTVDVSLNKKHSQQNDDSIEKIGDQDE